MIVEVRGVTGGGDSSPYYSIREGCESGVGESCSISRYLDPLSWRRVHQNHGLGIARGGYILKDSDGTPELILIATGSEVPLAMDAAAQIGATVRVVSMPCTARFDAQDAAYREQVLPAGCVKRLAIEAGHPDGWYKYVGLQGDVIGMKTFGESGPGDAVMAHFGFTVDHVVARAKAL